MEPTGTNAEEFPRDCGEQRHVEEPTIEVPERGSARYANLPKPEESHWARPEVCCLVRFKEVTAEGLLRHPVFERLLPDQVVHECDVDQAGLQPRGVVRSPPSGHHPADARRWPEPSPPEIALSSA